MTITLTVNGDAYTGWLDMSVTRSLDQFAHSFEFRATDRWAEDDSPRPIRLGDQCSVEQDGTLLTTGFVEDILYEVNSGGATLRISGRSKTGDLVDCSAIHKTGQWRNARPINIIEDLTLPFNILTVQDTDLATDAARIKRFDLGDGETVFDAVDKICRVRGWLPITTAEGWLHITRISRDRQRPRELHAEQTVRRSVQTSTGDRHSIYRVRSQTARFGAESSPRQAALQQLQVSDLGVKRYRPLVLHPEHGATLEELEAYAVWARNMRLAQSERIIYEMPGTLASDGEVWNPGDLVKVRDEQIGVDDVLVLCSTSLRESANGSTTELQLSRVEAYAAEPIPAKELVRKLRKL